jgi:protein-S-isoprenylcysteine O-methyltransferase Ste14
MTETLPSPLPRSSAAQPPQSPVYDYLMRLPMLAWSTALALASAAGLEQYIETVDPAIPGAVYAANVAMRISVIAYLVILAATVVIRRAPIGKSRGMEPRVSAMVGTFLITVIVLFPRRELSAAAAVVSTLLILAGDAFAVVVLLQLRRSFSIMPEARELVASGPYRFVRHPLYLAEEIATIGSVMQFLSVWTIMLLVVQIFFQLRRVKHEEDLLTQVFPHYASYSRKTARLIPGIY